MAQADLHLFVPAGKEREMGVRRIVVPLVGVESERKALALAFRAGAATGAHVDALFVLPDPNEALPYLGEGLTGGMIEDILASAQARGKACGELARQMFAETASAAGARVVDAAVRDNVLTGRFLAESGAVGEVVARAAWACDLVVAGDAVIEPSAFEAALIDAGRPVLVAPKGELPAAFGSNVFIAWRSSTEAGHAVTAALPFLKRAASVKLATVRREGKGGAEAADSIAAVTDYLAFHGVACTAQVFELGGRALSTALMETIVSEGADLLVMGGYGHSRLREFILGGVTRDVAGNAPVPILMAH